MNFKCSLLLLVGILFSCSNEEKAIEVVTDEVERGAVVRTTAINATDFDIHDLQSIFHIELEEMDIEDGGLLEEVEVTISFKDNTPDNGTNSVNAVLLETIPASEWSSGPNGLPITSLLYTYQEFLTTTGLTASQTAVTDQFLVHLNLKLTDGRVFNASNASSIILAFNTFFSSPFCYTINIIAPIPEDLFIGMYLMESIVDGPNGQTFVDVNGQPFANGSLVEVVKGHSTNTREFMARHNLHHVSIEAPRPWEFTVVGNQIVMGKNQLSSPEGYCIFNAAPTLLGPDSLNGTANLTDDSVFELWFVKGI